MTGWLRSLGDTVRALRRRPAWSALVVLTLGVGIGASTAVFSVVDGVAIRPLPYREPDALLRIGGVREGRPGLASISGPNFRDLEAVSPNLSHVAASTPGSIALRSDDGPADLVRGGYVSGDFFATLGVRAARGRVLDKGDDRPEAALVVVLSHAVWTSRFGGEDVLGRVVQLDGRLATIVGVMPPDFFPPEGAHLGRTRLWLPLAHTPLPVLERDCPSSTSSEGWRPVRRVRARMRASRLWGHASATSTGCRRGSSRVS